MFIRSIILAVWEAFPAFGTVSNGSGSSNNGGLARRELLACLRCRNPAIFVISGSRMPKGVIIGNPWPLEIQQWRLRGSGCTDPWTPRNPTVELRVPKGVGNVQFALTRSTAEGVGGLSLLKYRVVPLQGLQ